MIRVNLVEIGPTDGRDDIVRMPQAPLMGDNIELDDITYTVRAIIWTPHNPTYDVQVRYR